MTPDVQDAVVRFLEAGGTIALAAKSLNIHRDTIHSFMAKNPEFKDRVDGARELVDDAVEAELYAVATGRKQSPKGQIVAAIFWLKNRRPRSWRDSYHEDPAKHSAVDAVLAKMVEGGADVG